MGNVKLKNGITFGYWWIVCYCLLSASDSKHTHRPKGFAKYAGDTYKTTPGYTRKHHTIRTPLKRTPDHWSRVTRTKDNEDPRGIQVVLTLNDNQKSIASDKPLRHDIGQPNSHHDDILLHNGPNKDSVPTLGHLYTNNVHRYSPGFVLHNLKKGHNAYYDYIPSVSTVDFYPRAHALSNLHLIYKNGLSRIVGNQKHHVTRNPGYSNVATSYGNVLDNSDARNIYALNGYHNNLVPDSHRTEPEVELVDGKMYMTSNSNNPNNESDNQDLPYGDIYSKMSPAILRNVKNQLMMALEDEYNRRHHGLVHHNKETVVTKVDADKALLGNHRSAKVTLSPQGASTNLLSAYDPRPLPKDDGTRNDQHEEMDAWEYKHGGLDPEKWPEPDNFVQKQDKLLQNGHNNIKDSSKVKLYHNGTNKAFMEEGIAEDEEEQGTDHGNSNGLVISPSSTANVIVDATPQSSDQIAEKEQTNQRLKNGTLPSGVMEAVDAMENANNQLSPAADGDVEGDANILDNGGTSISPRDQSEDALDQDNETRDEEEQNESRGQDEETRDQTRFQEAKTHDDTVLKVMEDVNDLVKVLASDGHAKNRPNDEEDRPKNMECKLKVKKLVDFEDPVGVVQVLPDYPACAEFSTSEEDNELPVIPANNLKFSSTDDDNELPMLPANNLNATSASNHDYTDTDPKHHNDEQQNLKSEDNVALIGNLAEITGDKVRGFAQNATISQTINTDSESTQPSMVSKNKSIAALTHANNLVGMEGETTFKDTPALRINRIHSNQTKLVSSPPSANQSPNLSSDLKDKGEKMDAELSNSDESEDEILPILSGNATNSTTNSSQQLLDADFTFSSDNSSNVRANQSKSNNNNAANSDHPKQSKYVPVDTPKHVAENNTEGTPEHISKEPGVHLQIQSVKRKKRKKNKKHRKKRRKGRRRRRRKKAHRKKHLLGSVQDVHKNTSNAVQNTPIGTESVSFQNALDDNEHATLRTLLQRMDETGRSKFEKLFIKHFTDRIGVGSHKEETALKRELQPIFTPERRLAVHLNKDTHEGGVLPRNYSMEYPPTHVFLPMVSNDGSERAKPIKGITRNLNRREHPRRTAHRVIDWVKELHKYSTLFANPSPDAKRDGIDGLTILPFGSRLYMENLNKDKNSDSILRSIIEQMELNGDLEGLARLYSSTYDSDKMFPFTDETMKLYAEVTGQKLLNSNKLYGENTEQKHTDKNKLSTRSHHGNIELIPSGGRQKYTSVDDKSNTHLNLTDASSSSQNTINGDMHDGKGTSNNHDKNVNNIINVKKFDSGSNAADQLNSERTSDGNSDSFSDTRKYHVNASHTLVVHNDSDSTVEEVEARHDIMKNKTKEKFVKGENNDPNAEIDNDDSKEEADNKEQRAKIGTKAINDFIVVNKAKKVAKNSYQREKEKLVNSFKSTMEAIYPDIDNYELGNIGDGYIEDNQGNSVINTIPIKMVNTMASNQGNRRSNKSKDMTLHDDFDENAIKNDVVSRHVIQSGRSILDAINKQRNDYGSGMVIKLNKLEELKRYLESVVNSKNALYSKDILSRSAKDKIPLSDDDKDIVSSFIHSKYNNDRLNGIMNAYKMGADDDDNDDDGVNFSNEYHLKPVDNSMYLKESGKEPGPQIDDSTGSEDDSSSESNIFYHKIPDSIMLNTASSSDVKTERGFVRSPNSYTNPRMFNNRQPRIVMTNLHPQMIGSTGFKIRPRVVPATQTSYLNNAQMNYLKNANMKYMNAQMNPWEMKYMKNAQMNLMKNGQMNYLKNSPINNPQMSYLKNINAARQMNYLKNVNAASQMNYLENANAARQMNYLRNAKMNYLRKAKMLNVMSPTPMNPNAVKFLTMQNRLRSPSMSTRNIQSTINRKNLLKAILPSSLVHGLDVHMNYVKPTKEELDGHMNYIKPTQEKQSFPVNMELEPKWRALYKEIEKDEKNKHKIRQAIALKQMKRLKYYHDMEKNLEKQAMQSLPNDISLHERNENVANVYRMEPTANVRHYASEPSQRKGLKTLEKNLLTAFAQSEGDVPILLVKQKSQKRVASSLSSKQKSVSSNNSSASASALATASGSASVNGKQNKKIKTQKKKPSYKDIQKILNRIKALHFHVHSAAKNLTSRLEKPKEEGRTKNEPIQLSPTDPTKYITNKGGERISSKLTAAHHRIQSEDFEYRKNPDIIQLLISGGSPVSNLDKHVTSHTSTGQKLSNIVSHPSMQSADPWNHDEAPHRMLRTKSVYNPFLHRQFTVPIESSFMPLGYTNSHQISIDQGKSFTRGASNINPVGSHTIEAVNEDKLPFKNAHSTAAAAAAAGKALRPGPLVLNRMKTVNPDKGPKNISKESLDVQTQKPNANINIDQTSTQTSGETTPVKQNLHNQTDDEIMMSIADQPVLIGPLTDLEKSLNIDPNTFDDIFQQSSAKDSKAAGATKIMKSLPNDRQLELRYTGKDKSGAKADIRNNVRHTGTIINNLNDEVNPENVKYEGAIVVPLKYNTAKNSQVGQTKSVIRANKNEDVTKADDSRHWDKRQTKYEIHRATKNRAKKDKRKRKKSISGKSKHVIRPLTKAYIGNEYDNHQGDEINKQITQEIMNAPRLPEHSQVYTDDSYDENILDRFTNEIDDVANDFYQFAGKTTPAHTDKTETRSEMKYKNPSDVNHVREVRNAEEYPYTQQTYPVKERKINHYYTGNYMKRSRTPKSSILNKSLKSSKSQLRSNEVEEGKHRHGIPQYKELVRPGVSPFALFAGPLLRKREMFGKSQRRDWAAEIINKHYLERKYGKRHACPSPADMKVILNIQAMPGINLGANIEKPFKCTPECKKDKNSPCYEPPTEAKQDETPPNNGGPPAPVEGKADTEEGPPQPVEGKADKGEKVAEEAKIDNPPEEGKTDKEHSPPEEGKVDNVHNPPTEAKSDTDNNKPQEEAKDDGNTPIEAKSDKLNLPEEGKTDKAYAPPETITTSQGDVHKLHEETSDQESISKMTNNINKEKLAAKGQAVLKKPSVGAKESEFSIKVNNDKEHSEIKMAEQPLLAENAAIGEAMSAGDTVKEVQDKETEISDKGTGIGSNKGTGIGGDKGAGIGENDKSNSKPKKVKVTTEAKGDTMKIHVPFDTDKDMTMEAKPDDYHPPPKLPFGNPKKPKHVMSKAIPNILKVPGNPNPDDNTGDIDDIVTVASLKKQVTMADDGGVSQPPAPAPTDFKKIPVVDIIATEGKKDDAGAPSVEAKADDQSLSTEGKADDQVPTTEGKADDNPTEGKIDEKQVTIEGKEDGNAIEGKKNDRLIEGKKDYYTPSRFHTSVHGDIHNEAGVNGGNALHQLITKSPLYTQSFTMNPQDIETKITPIAPAFPSPEQKSDNSSSELLSHMMEDALTSINDVLLHNKGGHNAPSMTFNKAHQIVENTTMQLTKLKNLYTPSATVNNKTRGNYHDNNLSPAEKTKSYPAENNKHYSSESSKISSSKNTPAIDYGTSDLYDANNLYGDMESNTNELKDNVEDSDDIVSPDDATESINDQPETSKDIPFSEEEFEGHNDENAVSYGIGDEKTPNELKNSKVENITTFPDKNSPVIEYRKRVNNTSQAANEMINITKLKTNNTNNVSTTPSIDLAYLEDTFSKIEPSPVGVHVTSVGVHSTTNNFAKTSESTEEFGLATPIPADIRLNKTAVYFNMTSQNKSVDSVPVLTESPTYNDGYKTEKDFMDVIKDGEDETMRETAEAMKIAMKGFTNNIKHEAAQAMANENEKHKNKTLVQGNIENEARLYNNSITRLNSTTIREDVYNGTIAREDSVSTSPITNEDDLANDNDNILGNNTTKNHTNNSTYIKQHQLALSSHMLANIGESLNMLTKIRNEYLGEIQHVFQDQRDKLIEERNRLETNIELSSPSKKGKQEKYYMNNTMIYHIYNSTMSNVKNTSNQNPGGNRANITSQKMTTNTNESNNSNLSFQTNPVGMVLYSNDMKQTNALYSLFDNLKKLHEESLKGRKSHSNILPLGNKTNDVNVISTKVSPELLEEKIKDSFASAKNVRPHGYRRKKVKSSISPSKGPIVTDMVKSDKNTTACLGKRGKQKASCLSGSLKIPTRVKMKMTKSHGVSQESTKSVMSPATSSLIADSTDVIGHERFPPPFFSGKRTSKKHKIKPALDKRGSGYSGKGVEKLNPENVDDIGNSPLSHHGFMNENVNENVDKVKNDNDEGKDEDDEATSSLRQLISENVAKIIRMDHESEEADNDVMTYNKNESGEEEKVRYHGGQIQEDQAESRSYVHLKPISSHLGKSHKRNNSPIRNKQRVNADIMLGLRKNRIKTEKSRSKSVDSSGTPLSRDSDTRPSSNDTTVNTTKALGKQDIAMMPPIPMLIEENTETPVKLKDEFHEVEGNVILQPNGMIKISDEPEKGTPAHTMILPNPVRRSIVFQSETRDISPLSEVGSIGAPVVDEKMVAIERTPLVKNEVNYNVRNSIKYMDHMLKHIKREHHHQLSQLRKMIESAKLNAASSVNETTGNNTLLSLNGTKFNESTLSDNNTMSENDTALYEAKLKHIKHIITKCKKDKLNDLNDDDDHKTATTHDDVGKDVKDAVNNTSDDDYNNEKFIDLASYHDHTLKYMKKNQREMKKQNILNCNVNESLADCAARSLNNETLLSNATLVNTTNNADNNTLSSINDTLLLEKKLKHIRHILMRNKKDEKHNNDTVSLAYVESWSPPNYANYSDDEANYVNPHEDDDFPIPGIDVNSDVRNSIAYLNHKLKHIKRQQRMSKVKTPNITISFDNTTLHNTSSSLNDTKMEKNDTLIEYSRLTGNNESSTPTLEDEETNLNNTKLKHIRYVMMKQIKERQMMLGNSGSLAYIESNVDGANLSVDDVKYTVNDTVKSSQNDSQLSGNTGQNIAKAPSSDDTKSLVIGSSQLAAVNENANQNSVKTLVNDDVPTNYKAPPVTEFQVPIVSSDSTMATDHGILPVIDERITINDVASFRRRPIASRSIASKKTTIESSGPIKAQLHSNADYDSQYNNDFSNEVMTAFGAEDDGKINTPNTDLSTDFPDDDIPKPLTDTDDSTEDEPAPKEVSLVAKNETNILTPFTEADIFDGDENQPSSDEHELKPLSDEDIPKSSFNEVAAVSKIQEPIKLQNITHPDVPDMKDVRERKSNATISLKSLSTPITTWKEADFHKNDLITDLPEKKSELFPDTRISKTIEDLMRGKLIKDIYNLLVELREEDRRPILDELKGISDDEMNPVDFGLDFGHLFTKGDSNSDTGSSVTTPSPKTFFSFRTSTYEEAKKKGANALKRNEMRSSPHKRYRVRATNNKFSPTRIPT